jgi:predicted adenine nucleotide alpha hydrolase (AANH) superfamily ATPase
MGSASTASDRRLLLHICCAPCGTAALERLQRQGAVTLFFSNGNVYPADEYAKRLGEVRRLAGTCACGLVEDVYDHDAWRQWIAGLEHEPERGARCRRCFEFSLARAAQYAQTQGFDGVTTSLTISPHKSTSDILAVGRAVTDCFLDIDFKQEGGFRRSLELSRRHGLYRQDYCGCEFSLAERDGRRHSPTAALKNSNFLALIPASG